MQFKSIQFHYAKILPYILSITIVVILYLEWAHRPTQGWPGILKVALSRLTACRKSCDMKLALHCAIRGAQGVLPFVG